MVHDYGLQLWVAMLLFIPAIDIDMSHVVVEQNTLMKYREGRRVHHLVRTAQFSQ